MYSTIHCSLFLATKKFLGFMSSKSSLFLFPFFSLYLILYTLCEELNLSLAECILTVQTNMFKHSLCPLQMDTGLNICFSINILYNFEALLILRISFSWAHRCYHTASLVPPYRE